MKQIFPAKTDAACHACLPDIPHTRHAARKRHLQAMLRHVDRFVAPSVFLRDRSKPAASVMLRLARGASLTDEQVQAAVTYMADKSK